MLRSLTLTTLIISSLILGGCGKDGSTGDAYIALDWDWFVDGYNDNNPALPNTVSRNFDYSTKSGTYQCEYACSDGNGSSWYWEYEYTIGTNKGEKGKLFRKGDDGKDRYHNMFLHGLSKPSFFVNEKSANKKKKKELKPYSINSDDFEKIYHGEPILEEYTENGYTIIIKRRMFTLE